MSVGVFEPQGGSNPRSEGAESKPANLARATATRPRVYPQLRHYCA